MVFFNVLLISPDSNKFFAVFIATFFADLLNFFPKGLFTVFLIIFGDDLTNAFPIGSKFLNKELKTPLFLYLSELKHLCDMELLHSLCSPMVCAIVIQIQMYTILTYQKTGTNCFQRLFPVDYFFEIPI